MAELDLKGRKIYKFSMGTLRKDNPYKSHQIVEKAYNNEIILIHENTGKSQAYNFTNKLKVGDYVYITYGSELGEIAVIESQPFDAPENTNINGVLGGWIARKVKYLYKPIKKYATDLIKDRRSWLPSGYTTFYMVPDLTEANQLLFQPYYNINIVDSMEKQPEVINRDFYKDYLKYLHQFEGEINLSTINNYFQTLKIYLPKWCEKCNVDHEGLINYDQKELLKADIELRKATDTFKGLMRFSQYINGLIDYKPPLNQILFGPPGTGKTFRSKEIAVKIANPFFQYEEMISDNERFNILQEYNRLVESGKIIFTTFHQSMSYEDFIEGIRPETNEKGEITYEVQKGIFKDLCYRAKLSGDNDIEDALKSFQEKIINTGEQELITSRGKKFTVDYNGGSTFRINPKDSLHENPQYPASIENILKLYQGMDVKKVYNPSYVKGILDHFYNEYGLQRYNYSKSQGENYVIIIDEINRGNISAIFGELITLIEPDKRKGNRESLEIILPYSKEPFGVPNNVYIVGTMNTADRSVEALDTALRRRFSFVEVLPDPKILNDEEFIVSDYSMTDILEIINRRIEVLLDREHRIGHSYFFKLKSNRNKETILKEIFKDNIIPLLQEYFFGDYSKIGLVLGEGFVQIEEHPSETIFAQFNNQENDIEIGDKYELISIDEDFDIIEALKKLL